MTRFQQTIPLAIALLVLPVTQVQAQSTPITSDSITFNAPPPPPPSTGQPGRRSDAGSRGCEVDESSASEPPLLLALVPTQEAENTTVVFGKTAAERPTFWFYVPQRSPSTAIFVLQDQDGNPIYESEITLPETAGIVSLTLPETVAPLEMDGLYHWFFKLYCRSISPPDLFVDGWIQRESISPNLTEQLQTATPQQQVRLYAENGFWFDALTVAAELHQTNLEDLTLAELLGAVGLENVVGAAIAPP